jgi:REP element-mobilizing transposase RayT
LQALIELLDNLSNQFIGGIIRWVLNDWSSAPITVKYKINNWPPFNKRLWQRDYYEHINQYASFEGRNIDVLAS